MEILVTYGTHGEERTAIELGRSLTQDPVSSSGRIHTLEVNAKAVAQGVRCIDENFVLALKHPDPHAKESERRRAVRVLERCKRGDFAFILDLHTEPAEGKASSHMQAHLRTNRDALALGPYFGFRNTVIAECGFPEQFDNAVAMGIDENKKDPRHTIRQWRLMLKEFCEDFPTLGHYQEYAARQAVIPKYWYYGGTIPATTGIDPDQLDDAFDTADIGRSFEPLSQQFTADVNLDTLPASLLFKYPHGLNVGASTLKRTGLIGEFVYPLSHCPDEWPAAADRYKAALGGAWGQHSDKAQQA